MDKRAQDESKFISHWGSVARRKILAEKCWNQAGASTNIPLKSYRSIQKGISAF